MEVYSFGKLKDFAGAGGKAGALARMYQKGYPIPNGLVIFPSAFEEDELRPDAWLSVRKELKKLKGPYAVRSSALAEDSVRASFAGEFETVLNVSSDASVREAIMKVYDSRKGARVKAYSKAKGIRGEHEVAVILQSMVPSELSGVLFTADPVTGNRGVMVGNFVRGLGDKLVSGEANAQSFTLQETGAYEGPGELKRFSKKLFRFGRKLEGEFDFPQDIEWAISRGKLWILQSRPITTFVYYDSITQYWNHSYTGDFLWVAQEPFPSLMTPSTWSIWREWIDRNICGMPGIGNICGRMYINASLFLVMLKKFLRYGEEDMRDFLGFAVGPLPEGVEIPMYRFSILKLVKEVWPLMEKYGLRQIRLKRNFDKVVAGSPERYRAIISRIETAKTCESLAPVWADTFEYFLDMLILQDGTNDNYFLPFFNLRRKLKKTIGLENTERLLSTITGTSGENMSVGPSIGLSKIANGKMTKRDYLEKYGHRHHHENELSQPRPYEEPKMLDQLIKDFKKSGIDVEAQMEKRRNEFEGIWDEFSEKYPWKVKSLRKKVDKITKALKKREGIRSELTRSIDAARQFYLKAGKLLKIGDDVFLLTKEELLDALSGDTQVFDYLPTRRKLHSRCKKLPKYPGWIRGRFDPFKWAKDPKRRSDFHGFDVPVDDAKTFRGMPGSPGRVEGKVRIINSPEEGSKFKKGEILVARTTNIGWTPLFPRAAAVVTDIGAPLSHAAIVARELGIPAVVGCPGATSRLKTGDKVVVDGGKGTVELI